MRIREYQEKKGYVPHLVLLVGSVAQWLMNGTDVNISDIH